MVLDRQRSETLDGIEVLNIGNAYVGRLLARFLQEQGAHVTEIPFSSGDGRGEGNGAELLMPLITSADVLIDTTPAGALANDGPDPQQLAVLNPTLITCRLVSLPEEAGGVTGPPLEWVASAELGFYRPRGEPSPALEPLALASTYTALQTALLVAAALAARDADGHGCLIEQSLFGGGLLALCGRLQHVENESIRSAQRHRVPIAERYECSDGRYIQAEGTVPAVARSLCEAFGHPEWSDAVVAGLSGVASAEEEQEWRRRFAELFRSRSAWEWEQQIAESGGAASVCRTRLEWMQEQHTTAAEILVGERPDSVSVGPAVRLYVESNDDRTPRRVAANGGTPLSGVRVVDLCVILAGPTCGRLLGELGADVVKVDAPFWVSPPWVRTFGWLDVNRNKQSVIFDLRTESGREALWRLIDGADVLIENYRLGKIAAHGFGFEEVAKRRPGIVYVSLNAYDFGGPFSERPGWDPNAQAISGMELRAGGTVPVQAPVPINDYATGVAGAFGAILGLRHARRTGQSVHVRGSLARTASILLDSQRPWQALLDGEQATRPDWLESELSFAECNDGWIAVESRGAPEGTRELDRAGAIADLAARGVRAAAVRTPDELQDVEWVREAGLLRRWEHPVWGAMSHVFAAPRLTGMNAATGTPAPEPGSDTDRILAELGYSQSEVEFLYAAKAVQSTTPLFQT